MYGHLLLLLIAIETTAVLSTISEPDVDCMDIINHTPSASSPCPQFPVDIWIQTIPHLPIRDQIRFSVTNHRNRILIVSNLILFYPHYVMNYRKHFRTFLKFAPAILDWFSIKAENIVHIYDRLEVACRDDRNNQLLLELDEEHTITTDNDEPKILMDRLLSILQNDDLIELVAGLRLSSKTIELARSIDSDPSSSEAFKKHVAEILARVRDQISSETFDKQLKEILSKVKDKNLDSLDELRMPLLSELYRHDRLDFDTLLILLKCGIRFRIDEFSHGAVFPEGIPDAHGWSLVFPFTESTNELIVSKTISPTVFPLLCGSFWDERNALSDGLTTALFKVPDERLPSLIRIPHVFDHLLHHAERLIEFFANDYQRHRHMDRAIVFKLILHLIRTEYRGVGALPNSRFAFFNEARKRNAFKMFFEVSEVNELIDLLVSIPRLGINAKLDRVGNTAAHLYLEYRGFEGLASLIQCPGFDRTGVNDNGDTLLHAAVKGASAVQACTDLSLLWPELSIKTDTSSSEASSSGASEEIEVPGMIQLNAKNAAGQTALHIAVEWGYDHIVKLLLARDKIDPNLQDNRGCSALHIAVQWQKVQIVKQLLAHSRIELNLKNKSGCSALDIAVERYNWQIIELLVTHPKIDIDLIRTNCKPILLIAANKGSPGLIKLLLEIPDTDPNVIDTDGDSALHIAVKLVRADIVKLLLDHPKTDPDSPDSQGNSALQFAMKYDLAEIVEHFLEHSKTNRD